MINYIKEIIHDLIELYKQAFKKAFKMSNIIYLAVLGIVLVILFSFMFAREITKPKDLKSYLISQGYKRDKWNCLNKYVKNNSKTFPVTEYVSFCFDECKYYANYSNERTAIDLRTLNIYHTDTIAVDYTMNINDKIGTCKPNETAAERDIFEGTDIYNIYCRNAKARVPDRIKNFKNIVKNFSVKEYSVNCKNNKTGS